MPLLVFQALSLALNMPKGAEDGDGLVWIGGYNHEAAFSVALLESMSYKYFSAMDQIRENANRDAPWRVCNLLRLMAANGGVKHELRAGQFGYADFRRDILTSALQRENIFRADPKDHGFALIPCGIQ